MGLRLRRLRRGLILARRAAQLVDFIVAQCNRRRMVRAHRLHDMIRQALRRLHLCRVSVVSVPVEQPEIQTPHLERGNGVGIRLLLS